MDILAILLAIITPLLTAGGAALTAWVKTLTNKINKINFNARNVSMTPAECLEQILVLEDKKKNYLKEIATTTNEKVKSNLNQSLAVIMNFIELLEQRQKLLRG